MITPVIYYVLACRYILFERPEHIGPKCTHTGKEKANESEDKNHYIVMRFLAEGTML